MPSFMTLRLQTQKIRGNKQTDKQTDRQTNIPTMRFISIDIYASLMCLLLFICWLFREIKYINTLNSILFCLCNELVSISVNSVTIGM